jgi:FAD dependent oxidoreductase
LVFGKTKAQAYDTAAYKCAADDLLLAKGAEVLFHGFAAGVLMDGDMIRALLVETKSGRCALLGHVFIDCSGDGDLAAWAGAPFELGDGAGNMLYPTTMFRVNGVDPAAAGEAWKLIPELMEDAEHRGERFPRKGAIVRPQKNPVEWRVNVTQIKTRNGKAIDGTDADELSGGEIEGRRQALAFFDFLRRMAPGFGNAYIVDIPPQIGIRETRRITGRY